MSNETAKFINSQRRHKTDVHIARQVKIAKASSAHIGSLVDRQPHRLAKKHAMDCGNPKCYLCGNPRKTHKDKLTAQEKRMYQDLDRTSDKHSNGLPSQDNDE
jgi:hypothetical protein